MLVIVGVFNGKISKLTQGADRIMVVSTMPLVIGNKQPNHENAKPIAFVGQVPVRVTGSVSTGDYVIASGQEDGTAIAIHPSQLQSNQINQIIGKAWDSSSEVGTKLINVAITPLDLPAQLLESIESRQEKLEQENRELRQMIEDIQEQLSQL